MSQKKEYIGPEFMLKLFWMRLRKWRQHLYCYVQWDQTLINIDWAWILVLWTFDWMFVKIIGRKSLNKKIVSALLQHKENFKEMDAQESQRLVRGQKDRLDYEVRKFRRRRLVQYHDLEQDLLREELNKRQNQLESAHNMLLRHHEMTQVRFIIIY